MISRVQHILTLENHYRKALIESDLPTLKHLMWEDVLFIHPNGELTNKEQQLIFYKSAPTYLEFTESIVRHFETSAVVTLRVNLQGTSYRNTRVWSFIDGKWLIVTDHKGLISP